MSSVMRRLRKWRALTLTVLTATVFAVGLWDMPRAEAIWRVTDGAHQYPFQYVTEDACDIMAQRANHNALGKYYCVPGVEYLQGWGHSASSGSVHQADHPDHGPEPNVSPTPVAHPIG